MEYDLNKKKVEGESSFNVKAPITAEKKRDLLKDFIELPREYWYRLPRNSVIRYEKTDGTFGCGGLVERQFVSKEGKEMTEIKMGYGQYQKSYVIGHENINILWKKKDSIIEFEFVTKAIQQISIRLSEIEKKLDMIDTTKRKSVELNKVPHYLNKDLELNKEKRKSIELNEEKRKNMENHKKDKKKINERSISDKKLNRF